MKIFVYIDHFKGEAVPASWEAIGAAKSFGAQVSAIIVGEKSEALAKTAITYGADDAYIIEDAALADFRAEAYTSALAPLLSEQKPDSVLFANTARTRELSGMLAVDLNSGVLIDVTALTVEGDTLVATRPIYDGKLFEKSSN